MFIQHFIELYFETAWWKGMPSYTYNTEYGIFSKNNGLFLFFNMYTIHCLNQINSLFEKNQL